MQLLAFTDSIPRLQQYLLDIWMATGYPGSHR